MSSESTKDLDNLSDLKISKLTLGTMTFGEQVSAKLAYELLAMSIDLDVNFIDTAEMYPVYPSAKTYGLSERIIGDFIKSRHGYGRDSLVLATKVASSNPFGIGATQLSWIRGGADGLKLTKKNITEAVEGSLRRLQTDYIDLLQLHWPERPIPVGDSINTDFLFHGLTQSTTFFETLTAIDGLIKEGKVRFFGVSNETAWGLTKMTAIAERENLPRPVTIQNTYNLLNRSFENNLSEAVAMEGVGLIAYSPLAGGRLTGKYIGNQRPIGARYSLWPGPKNRYHNSLVNDAVSDYCQLAEEFGLSPVGLALGFNLANPYCISTVIGATAPEHLYNAVAALDRVIPDEVFSRINEIHRRFPNPAVIGATS